MDIGGEICQYNPRDEELRYIFDANITLKQLFLQVLCLCCYSCLELTKKNNVYAKFKNH